MTRRHLALPARGAALVSTDVHGNGRDFRALEQRFRDAHAHDADTRWVILGDLVHGPSPEDSAQCPALFEQPDESAWIVERVIALRAEFPERVHFVLGNHDWAHVGGTRTRKFYADEAAQLEATMTADAIARMRALFCDALLAVSTPCGALLTHASPGEVLTSLDDLDAIELPCTQPSHAALVRAVTTPYGQVGAVTDAMLARVSRAESPLRIVIHGHDKDDDGWFAHDGNQGCPVIFGARRERKCYLRLDLTARYGAVDALGWGREIVALYP